jgi:hypothetical protein
MYFLWDRSTSEIRALSAILSCRTWLTLHGATLSKWTKVVIASLKEYFVEHRRSAQDYWVFGLQWLRLVLSNGSNKVDISHPLICGPKQIQFPKCCVLSNIGWWIKFKNPATASVISVHHRQNRLESNYQRDFQGITPHLDALFQIQINCFDIKYLVNVSH